MTEGVFPGGGPETLLGVVRAMPEPPAPRASVVVPVEDRERLARVAAEVLRDAGTQAGAGEIIVLAAWLGGMD